MVDGLERVIVSLLAGDSHLAVWLPACVAAVLVVDNVFESPLAGLQVVVVEIVVGAHAGFAERVRGVSAGSSG